MNILLFEDHRVESLYPITTGRPAYAISCGSFRWIDWVLQCGSCRAVVRPHLKALQQADFPALATEAEEDQPWMLVNARIVPSLESFQMLQRVAREVSSGVLFSQDSLAIAVLPSDRTVPSLDLSYEQLPRWIDAARLRSLPTIEGKIDLFRYPHDVVRFNMQTLPGSLQYRIAHGQYKQAADGVFMAEGASLGQHVVTDTRDGPIILEQGASVGPYCYLSGPAHLGAHARIIEHAAIKDAVSLGHTTKIGGEVEASIIEPYTNKQHHGFLGHSYLGSWINLGAGTCNSDLKNTYGDVKMEYGGHRVSTGMQFVGCMMGDYAKSAINTGIFTGKTIGVCSMVYGFVTTNVPSFVNYARLFGQVTELPADVMIATQKRMFSRRNVRQRECDVQLIYAMYELTRSERQLAGEPLSL